MLRVVEPEVQRRRIDDGHVGFGTQQRAHLADGVGDVAVTIRPPATDEPDELVRLIVVLVELEVQLLHRLGHGEAEVVVAVQEPLGDELLEDLVVGFQRLLHLEDCSIREDVVLLLREDRHIELLCGGGHMVSYVLVLLTWSSVTMTL